MKKRLLEPEEMDDPHLSPDLHRAALAGLARLNQVSYSIPSIWRFLEHEYRLQRNGLTTPFTVLDLATGGGDLPIALAEKARRKAYDWRVLGCDKSQVALEYAAGKAGKTAPALEWLQRDVTREPLPACDWVVSSLFIHHLDATSLVQVLARMAEAARYGVLIDDLERNWPNRILVWLGAHLLSRSPIVHRDSDRSVRAALSLDEMAELARQAGLTGVRIRRRFPARFQMVWKA